MEIKGFNENEVSEQNKEALQSETWQKARTALESEVQHFTDAPEIQHFAVEKVNKNDNVYGVGWGNIVREYLKKAYSKGNTQADIVSDGITYKVLKRERVTAFYDADGRTLFDVENKRLEREYGYVIGEEKMNAGSDEESNNAEEVGEESSENDMPADSIVSIDTSAIKQMAKEKLEKEMKDDKDKSFAEPVIRYLLKRCEEDAGLAQDVTQEHKTWSKCRNYIYEQARKQTKGNCCAIHEDVVYEWAEDYYHRDDKAEKEHRAKKEAERKAKQKREAEERKVKTMEKGESASKKKEDISKESKLKKSGKDIEGQLDMFSMMDM